MSKSDYKGMILRIDRSHLKNRIFVQRQGRSEFQLAGIRQYFAGLKPEPNEGFGPKDIFMTAFKKIGIRSMVLIACAGIITGCQILGHAAGSKKIPTKHLLFIPRQGSLHLRWEARHLTIELKGKISQNLLTTNGHIDMTGDGVQHYTMLDRLIVDMYFADSAGNVLDKQTLYSVDESPLNNMTQRTFKRSFKLPKRTSYIAFGYDGTARKGEFKTLQKKEKDVVHRFQHSPFR